MAKTEYYELDYCYDSADRCPACGSDLDGYEDLVFDGAFIYREQTCPACGRKLSFCYQIHDCEATPC